LTVLSDFLRQLSVNDPSFSPLRYKELLSSNTSRSNKFNIARPLGAADPLGIIDGLCESLEVLWQARQSLRLDRFNSFKFSGPGLLQGREDFNSRWETILAYCGGWVYRIDDHGKWVKSDQSLPQKLGKCGNTPLILGRENLCAACHKLICTHCGFCSQSCEDAGLREARLPLPKVQVQ
jgi:hypothetical protein